jgi:hypothetical protein
MQVGDRVTTTSGRRGTVMKRDPDGYVHVTWDWGDPTTEAEEDLAAAPPLTTGQSQRQRCTSLNASSGKRCKNFALNNSTTCQWHTQRRERT